MPEPKTQPALDVIERLERGARATARLRFVDECRRAGVCPEKEVELARGQARLTELLAQAGDTELVSTTN